MVHYIHEQQGLRPVGDGTYAPVMRPRVFRKPRMVGDSIIRPVNGGRWSIRKRLDGRWRAWTSGRAQHWSRTFDTHAEAIHWATKVSKAYKNYPSGYADDILRKQI